MLRNDYGYNSVAEQIMLLEKVIKTAQARKVGCLFNISNLATRTE
jgi:hypothetical protein